MDEIHPLLCTHIVPMERRNEAMLQTDERERERRREREREGVRERQQCILTVDYAPQEPFICSEMKRWYFRFVYLFIFI